MPKLTKIQVETNTRFYKDVEKNWPHRKGKTELLQHLSGKKVCTRAEAMLAQCYHCCGGYEDGPYDCLCSTCPLYDYMPYRDARARKEMTEEQKQALIDRFKRAREAKLSDT